MKKTVEKASVSVIPLCFNCGEDGFLGTEMVSWNPASGDFQLRDGRKFTAFKFSGAVDFYRCGNCHTVIGIKQIQGRR